MKIVYHCTGMQNASLLAAAIHLGKLSHNQLPTYSELVECAYFDDNFFSDYGKIILMGTDLNGDQVYAMGHKNIGKVVINVLEGVGKIFGIPDREIEYRDAQPYVNSAISIGWRIKNWLGGKKIGEKIIVYGVRSAYPSIVKLTNR